MAALVAIALLITGCGGGSDGGGASGPSGDDASGDRPGRAANPAKKPNLLVVMTDDQTIGSFNSEVMPKATRFFGEFGGTVFDQAIAAPPLCCPARAGFLTGRYAHNHGVLENTVGYASMRGKDETFPAMLQDRGYRTGMIGKFLNGYGDVADAAPAPGFDRWFAIKGYAAYENFEVSDDGEVRFIEDYATEALTSEAVEFMSERDPDPFFLWLSYNAPHTVRKKSGPCAGLAAQPPDRKTFERFADAELERPASFDEKDTSDRPSLADFPDRLGPRDIAEATRAWRCSLAAMFEVDRQFGKLIGALRRSDRLEDTVIVFLSDNGFFYGEHRLTDDKRLPLEPALRVPMAIRVGADVSPKAEAPGSVDRLVSQVDLAPTMLDYAGAKDCPRGQSCEPLDGRSLRPLLEGDEGSGWPNRRAIPLTLDDGWTYDAIRTERELYLETTAARKRDFPSPQPELYDLADDPDQLTNLAAVPADQEIERIKKLGRRLDAAVSCSGIRGRNRRLDGRPFCE